MKRREVEKYLRKNGCVFVRHGAKHDVWENADTGDRAAVPRHADIPRGTVQAICRELNIPLPPGL